jgi:POT family proton-dependent oligopeptide transporter
MMAILSLFLQAKYGLSVAKTGDYYSWFYFGIYATALLGGLAADWMRRYKSVILVGQIMMIVGYVLIAMPFMSFSGSLAALMIIALGNGLFKGNLQVVVGQLYDGEKYAKLRDTAFLFFYMGVNIGAFAAPFIASGVRNWWLLQHGFLYDSNLTTLCHQFLNNSLTDTSQLQLLAQKVTIHADSFTGLTDFAPRYIQVFSQGYNWAFGIAALAMLASLFVFIIFNKNLPSKSVQKTTKQLVEAFQIKQPLKQRKVTAVSVSLIVGSIVIFQLLPGLDIGGKLGLSLAIGLFIAFIAFIYLMASDKERPNVLTLIFLYIITVFFWMSFNQNGLILTQFAVEYTVKDVSAFTYLFFDFKSISCVLLVIVSVALMVHEKSTLRYRFIGGGLTVIFGLVCYYFIKQSSDLNTISPEVFQSFNPLFVMLLMPVIIWFFGFLNRHGLEPSTPRKIAIGLLIAGLAFVVLIVGSAGLNSPNQLSGAIPPASSRVSPYWLMGTYFMLTMAEIFLSPMGASFVSRISPKRFQGLMQGGWLFTTAVGSKLLVVGSFLWDKVSLPVLWGIFALICVVSALLVFSIIKRLEKSTSR